MLWPLFTVGDFWDFARPVALAGAAAALAIFVLLFAIWWKIKPLYGLAAAALITSFLPITLHSDLLPLRTLSSPWMPWLGAAVFLCPLGLTSLFLLRQVPNPKRNESSIVFLGLSTLLPLVWLLVAPIIVGPGTFDGAILLATGLPCLVMVALCMPDWRTIKSGWLLIGGAFCMFVSAILLLLALTNISRGAINETFYLLGLLTGITLFALAPIRNSLRLPAREVQKRIVHSDAKDPVRTSELNGEPRMLSRHHFSR